MRAIREPLALPADLDPAFVAFITARTQAMVESGETYSPDTHGWFLVIEPGDDPDDAADHHDCFALLTSPCGDAHFGEPGFVTPFSWIVDYGSFYEGVIVMSDGGEFISVLIPKCDGVDAQLLTLCADQASDEPMVW